MTDILEPLKQHFQISLNPHLHVGGPKMPVEYPLTLKNVYSAAKSKGIVEAQESNMLVNLSSLSDDQIRSIAGEFGEEGIFKLNLLAVSSSPSEFKHFYEVIAGDFLLQRMRDGRRKVPLQVDNAILKSGPELNGFNHNVVNVSLSRKLFNPGRREGYLVYGIGGPRILVSLPFIGAGKFTYDVYNNSVDVVTSLNVRGYSGSFLLLDSLEGLNKQVFGEPAWLLWFSIIAAHSDLVIFVREAGKPFSASQNREIAFTPDRVGKKIVELNSGELTWAKKEDVDPTLKSMYVLPGKKGFASAEEWEEDQYKRMAGPFIDMYNREAFPDDRLIVLHENGSVSEHPLVDL